MKILEVLRHSIRVKPGQNLSRVGVALARALGQNHPPVDACVTSPVPRAVQTAVAMGFAIDAEHPGLAEMAEAVAAEVAWDAGFPAFIAAVRRGGAAAALARAQAALYAEILRDVPEGGHALVVSHGGIVEAGAIGAVPDQDLSGFGGPLDCLEGVRLAWEDGRFLVAEILRR